MAGGLQTVGTLNDSLNIMVAAARITREQVEVMTQLVDRVTLDDNTGLSWGEVTFSKLVAQSITDTTVLDNPQIVSDTKFTITPTITGIQTVIPDKVKRRIARVAWAKMGSQAQSAMERKKDEDGLIVLDGAGTSLSGAGTTLTSGVIAAAKSRISSNATEPAKPPYRCVLHGYQIKDLADELLSGLGTYPIEQGLTATVFSQGFKLPIAGVEVFEDGNIVIDGNDDAKGGVFAKEGIVLVQGKSPWRETRREPQIAGGADSVFLYDEYAYGERLPGGTTSGWVIEIMSDASVPTS